MCPPVGARRWVFGESLVGTSTRGKSTALAGGPSDYQGRRRTEPHQRDFEVGGRQVLQPGGPGPCAGQPVKGAIRMGQHSPTVAIPGWRLFTAPAGPGHDQNTGNGRRN
jgi:hypothetical protein